MRLAFILSLVLMFTFQSTLCQVIDEPETNKSQQESYNFYMSKKKSNETTGWILLGSGAAMFIGGLVLADSAEIDDGIGGITKKAVGAAFLVYGGGGLAIASVPFFIIARNNKNKANLALKGETISFNNVPTYKSNYLVFSLTIPLDN